MLGTQLNGTVYLVTHISRVGITSASLCTCSSPLSSQEEHLRREAIVYVMLHLQEEVGLVHVPHAAAVGVILGPKLLQELGVPTEQLLHQLPQKNRAALLVRVLMQPVDYELGVSKEEGLPSMCVNGQVACIVVNHYCWGLLPTGE